jgi:hypothetical protein
MSGPDELLIEALGEVSRNWSDKDIAESPATAKALINASLKRIKCNSPPTKGEVEK